MEQPLPGTGARALPPPPDTLPQPASLFLDFDGTLVELADRPDAVTADPGVRRLVARLERALRGRLAVVTGREVAFVRQRLGLPWLTVAGNHGQEIRMADGTARVAEPSAAVAAVADWLERMAPGHSGVLVERKLFGTALHYRQAPQESDWCLQVATDLARRHGLELQPGKMMVELRTPGWDKGSAVGHILTQPGFAGSHPVVVGDDLTDETAFHVAAESRGWGVLVGTPRRTAAEFGLPGVGAVHGWLAALAGLAQA